MAGFSQVELCNGALTHCGEPSITSLNQDGKAARVLKRNYDLVRKRVLMKYRWNFAKSRAELAADPTAPVSGFTYKHALPSDCLAMIGIVDDTQAQANYTASDIVFKNEGGFLLSDETPLNIVYIADISDTSMFDPAFAAVFEYYLATKIFYDLTKGSDRYTALVREREQAVREARVAHAFQNSPEVIVASEWVDSRIGNTGRYRDHNSV